MGRSEKGPWRRLAALLLGRRWVVGAALATLVGAAGVATARLEIEAGVSAFTDGARPEKLALDRIEAQFGAEDGVFVVVDVGDDVFRPERLALLRRLTETLERLEVPGPGGARVAAVERSFSLTNVKDVFGGELTFESRPLVDEDIPSDVQALEAIRHRARKNPLIVGNLLSATSDRVCGVLLELRPGLDDAQRASLVAQVRKVIAHTTRAAPELSIFVTGAAVLTVDSAAAMETDLKRFLPLVYALVIVVLFVTVRRVAGVLFALANVTLCLVVGMGALRWVGGSINNPTTALPPLLVILSVSNAIHILSELARNAREVGAAAAPQRTLEELLPAQLICNLTTAVGFGALSVSNIPALRDFGLAAALALLLAYVVSFLFASLAVRLRPPDTFVAPGSAALSARLDRWIEAYVGLVIRRPWPMLALGLVLTAFFLAGVTRVQVDENLLTQFGPEAPIRRATAFMEPHLGGTSSLVVSLKAKEAGGFEQPEALRRLDRLGEFMRRETGFDSTTSMADFVKLMNRGFNGEADEAHRVPDTREQVAQLLLLSSDDTLNDYTDATHTWLRLVARSREHSAARLGDAVARVEAEVARLFPAAAYEAVVTGDAKLEVLMVRDLVGSQTSSLGLSFVLIFAPIIALFRSWRAGAFSVPSNLFPVAVCLGCMGWLGVPLGTATSMSATVVLGIAVDDTIHFIHHMRLRLAEHGDLERALRETFHTKGAGVLWTAVVVTAGFGTLVASSYAPTADFGLLTGAAMVSGAVGELLILPPLMLVTKTRLGVPPPSAPSQASLHVASPAPQR